MIFRLKEKFIIQGVPKKHVPTDSKNKGTFYGGHPVLSNLQFAQSYSDEENLSNLYFTGCSNFLHCNSFAQTEMNIAFCDYLIRPDDFVFLECAQKAPTVVIS